MASQASRSARADARPTPWPMEWDGDSLRIVDQTRLPEEERVLRLRDAEEVAEAIAVMRVRGAPAIGIAAAYGVALAALRAHERGEDARAAALAAAAHLRSTRPTAVNLAAGLDRRAAQARGGARAAALIAAAVALHDEDREQSRRLIGHGVALLAPGTRVLTHCHTGPLATGGGGTALGVVIAGHRDGRVAFVWVDETRPRLQGARITALELRREGVPFALIADGAAAGIIARGEVDQVWVGADRVARNGDVVNKVGTYGLALACAAHRVPLHVAFPRSTFDPALARGGDCPIEERAGAEVLQVAGTAVAPAGTEARNPAFDVTPAPLVTAWVTDRGIARDPSQLA